MFIVVLFLLCLVPPGLSEDSKTLTPVKLDKDTTQSEVKTSVTNKKLFRTPTLSPSIMWSNEERNELRGKKKVALQITQIVNRVNIAEPSKRFNILRAIADEGAHGDVFIATDNLEKKEVVIKKILMADEDNEDILNEVTVLAFCKHMNLVRFIGAYIHKEELGRRVCAWREENRAKVDFSHFTLCFPTLFSKHNFSTLLKVSTRGTCTHVPHVPLVNAQALVTEFMAAGKLTNILDTVYACDLRMREDLIAFVILEILRGLEFLHEMGVVHRDLKSHNILLSAHGVVKLCDFGSAGNSREKRISVVGTPLWMAPEVINMEGYSTMADIWSLGIVVLEMIDGVPPHSELNVMAAMFAIVKGPIPTPKRPDTSDSLKDFLSRCVNKDPKSRFTASQLLTHGFLKDRMASLHPSIFTPFITVPRTQPAEVLAS